MAQDTELEELYGKISSVIYTNEENGWTVLRMETDGGTDATVVGTLPSAYPGEELHVFGEWTTHPNHGRQFKSEYAERSLPRTKDDIYKYLAGHAVKGIGPATAALIVDRFGDRTLDVLERQPERLTEIRGISPAKAEAVTRDFRRQAQLRRLMEFLCAYGLKPLLAVRLYRFYGEEAMDAVSEDPYIIASPHIGGSFAEADRLALEQGAAADDPRRVRAAAVFELRHNAGNGHCFIPTDKLAAATARFIGVEHDSALAAIEALAESGAVVRTAWVYSLREGTKNFCQTIRRLSREREEISVVADQTGAPTLAEDLAQALIELYRRGEHLKPMHLLHFTNAGSTTWHGFAERIVELEGARCRVKPISTSEYPAKAPRPAFSVLSLERIRRLGIEPRPWAAALEDAFQRMKEQS